MQDNKALESLPRNTILEKLAPRPAKEVPVEPQDEDEFSCPASAIFAASATAAWRWNSDSGMERTRGSPTRGSDHFIITRRPGC